MRPPASSAGRTLRGGGAASAVALARRLRGKRYPRLSYLPPLMVYLAAGISSLTGIVSTFFVKDYLGLSAEFIAALGFWVGLPWALKVPMGHLVDLLWKWKGALVCLGAALVAASLFIMIGLLGGREGMTSVMSAEAWYVLASLLSPVGYVLQDAVADAMTVEAVPRTDDAGKAVDEERRKQMHTTMQTLGRVAVVGGSTFVALANVYFLRGVDESMPLAAQTRAYLAVYEWALAIPAIAVAGVALAAWLRHRMRQRLAAAGLDAAALAAIEPPYRRPPVNAWVLGGGLALTAASLALGLAGIPGAQEIVFVVSEVILGVLVWRLIRRFEPAQRRMLIATLFVIVMYRSTPVTGPGSTWWMIDELGFDPPFFATLSLIGNGLALAGLFLFRRFMADHSITAIIVILSVVQALIALPTLGMYYGLHEWTAAHTGGVVDARFIALVDTALESPFGQIAMVPMLAWIARWAPENLKATYFAVIASFSNMSSSAAQLGSKYLNAIFVVTREVKDPATGAVKVAADYSQLGDLMLWTIVLGLAMPLAAVLVVRMLGIRPE